MRASRPGATTWGLAGRPPPVHRWCRAPARFLWSSAQTDRLLSTSVLCRYGNFGAPAQRNPQLQQDIELMLELANSLRADPERPAYHVMPRHGWINDPNGPVHYDGRYHLFYQHIINGCEWDFGIVWGHAVSTDLVHWEHLAPALVPTPGGPDADGCFSGCCLSDGKGPPVILYTGVRLRSNAACGALPAPEYDLNLPFIESQLWAAPDTGNGDQNLTHWIKGESALIGIPPLQTDEPLVGWRDPFIFEKRPNADGVEEWGMLMGSGRKNVGGSVMIYRSTDLTSGWRYDGLLCEADNTDTGAMWECPLLFELEKRPDHAQGQAPAYLNGEQESAGAATAQSPLDSSQQPMDSQEEGFRDRMRHGAEAQQQQQEAADTTDQAQPSGRWQPPAASDSDESEDERTEVFGGSELAAALANVQLDEHGQPDLTHLLCISPDAPTNPVLYYLGTMDKKACRFQLTGAKGPLRLDLGDVLYAPNCMEDPQGRLLMWGWLQERRKVGSYDYAGCLSVPRIMYLRGDRLHQEPAPEVKSLRRGRSWQQARMTIEPEESTPLEGIAGAALDIECTFERGSATAAGLLFRSWNAGGEGSASVVYDWERNVLEVVFLGGGEGRESLTGGPIDMEDDDEGGHRIGGEVSMRPNEQVQMRILLDHSCMEVYLSSGEVLSTRVYRGHPPDGADAGIDFVAYGGSAEVKRAEVWEMRSIWKRDLDVSKAGTVFDERSSTLKKQTMLGSHPVPVGA